jgi:hypothetical protein
VAACAPVSEQGINSPGPALAAASSFSQLQPLFSPEQSGFFTPATRLSLYSNFAHSLAHARVSSPSPKRTWRTWQLELEAKKTATHFSDQKSNGPVFKTVREELACF